MKGQRPTVTNKQVTPGHFRELLRRASPLEDCPEKQLMLAIFTQAIADATCQGSYFSAVHRKDAENFFRERAYRPMCELLDLDPDWIGMVLQQYAGIDCGTSWGKAA